MFIWWILVLTVRDWSDILYSLQKKQSVWKMKGTHIFKRKTMKRQWWHTQKVWRWTGRTRSTTLFYSPIELLHNIISVRVFFSLFINVHGMLLYIWVNWWLCVRRSCYIYVLCFYMQVTCALPWKIHVLHWRSNQTILKHWSEVGQMWIVSVCCQRSAQFAGGRTIRICNWL